MIRLTGNTAKAAATLFTVFEMLSMGTEAVDTTYRTAVYYQQPAAAEATWVNGLSVCFDRVAPADTALHAHAPLRNIVSRLCHGAPAVQEATNTRAPAAAKPVPLTVT